MKLGFIGTGIITTSVVTGFCESGMENLQIVVSPRNKERAQMLHEKYPEIVSVAADNQEVVDRSDWVFAALLPKAAEDILKPLHIGPEKKFINLVATLSLKRIEEMFGRGHSSAGRALRSQRKGRGFESRCLHDRESLENTGFSFVFKAFLCF